MTIAYKCPMVVLYTATVQNTIMLPQTILALIIITITAATVALTLFLILQLIAALQQIEIDVWCKIPFILFLLKKTRFYISTQTIFDTLQLFQSNIDHHQEYRIYTIPLMMVDSRLDLFEDNCHYLSFYKWQSLNGNVYRSFKRIVSNYSNARMINHLGKTKIP